MKNRSWKTSIAGIAGLAVLAGSGMLIYAGKATFTEVGQSLGAISLFLASIAALLAKDKDVTGLPKN
jgi:hypothetical protein